MKNYCERAIGALGVPITVTTPDGSKSGTGVIMPSRNMSKNNGGVSFGAAGISEPMRYTLFTELSTAQGMRCGDRVSDGENEYYVLWTDSVSNKYGSYAKAAMQLAGEGRVNE